MIRAGIRSLARGSHQGSALLSGLGTALLAVGWLRRRRGPEKRLLYARTLRSGEGLRIRMVGSDEELEVEG